MPGTESRTDRPFYRPNLWPSEGDSKIHYLNAFTFEWPVTILNMNVSFRNIWKISFLKY